MNYTCKSVIKLTPGVILGGGSSFEAPALITQGYCLNCFSAAFTDLYIQLTELKVKFKKKHSSTSHNDDRKKSSKMLSFLVC